MMRWWMAMAALIGGHTDLAAQTPPGTEIHLVPLVRRGSGFELGSARNVTNRKGYDNQPHFSPDGKSLYFSSNREGQSDIYRLDLASGAVSAFTRTPESEYSPTVVPGGREIAVVRVERDSTQRLWAFPLSGGQPRLVLEAVKPVGYQAWLDDGTVALFVLGSPATLLVVDLRSGSPGAALSGIGRALHPIPGRRAVSVTQPMADSTWQIVEVEAGGSGARPIAKLPAGAEYYVWLPDRSLLSAAGNAVYHLRPGGEGDWTVVGVLTGPGMGRLSRLAVSPAGDWLAVVAEER